MNFIQAVAVLQGQPEKRVTLLVPADAVACFEQNPRHETKGTSYTVHFKKGWDYGIDGKVIRLEAEVSQLSISKLIGIL